MEGQNPGNRSRRRHGACADRSPRSERTSLWIAGEIGRVPGVPVWLNPSLNVKGDPIGEPPADALACFLGTGIDYLALHDMLIAKNRFHRIFSPFRSAY